MGASVCVFHGRGVHGALAYYQKVPGYFPLCLPLAPMHCRQTNSVIDRQRNIFGISMRYLRFYGQTIIHNEENWRTYVDGVVVRMAHQRPDSGWELRLDTMANVQMPDGSEAITRWDENGRQRQYIGRFEDLPNLLWLLGATLDTHFGDVRGNYRAKLDQLSRYHDYMMNQSDMNQYGAKRADYFDLLEYCPLPKTIERRGTSRSDKLSFDDMWDMMGERGIPVAKGLCLTGYEHLCLFPKVDVVWGAIGQVGGCCIRDKTSLPDVKPRRSEYANQA